MTYRACWLVGLAVACSASKPHDAVDAGVDAAPLALGTLMPQEALGSSTATLASPTVVPIPFHGDPQRADVEAFYPQLAASPAWATLTAEYGIAALSVGSAIHLAGSAVGSDADVRALLSANLGSAGSPW